MSPRPGVDVSLLDTPSAISLPTDTGVGFMVGQTDRGPLTPVLSHSLSEWVATFGARQNYSPAYDAVEVFFREGGYALYTARVVGPAATSGTLNLMDGAAAISLVATAIGPGAWSNTYKVAVVAGVGAGTFKIQVTDAANNVLEDSGDLLTQADAIQWSQNSSYVRLSLGVSPNNPAVVAATVLSAGTDDRAAITDAQWATAIATFTIDLGPGQIFAPGRITDTGHSQLIAHAEANGRVAIFDLADTSTVGTLQTAITNARSRSAAGFAPWPVFPGVVGQTRRTVPPSPMIAGIIARNDPSLGANHPSAGRRYGVSRFAIDLSQPNFSDPNKTTLNNSGVNLIRRISGSIVVYGWRSTVNPATDANWEDFGNGRYIMSLRSRLRGAAENFVFELIDGQNGHTINSFRDALVGVCMEDFLDGQLFGDTASDAFIVDTGPAVNTLTTIAANELHGIVQVKPAQMAEYIPIQIVKRAVTETF
jgi:phage tail sheath protein FI